MFYFTMSLRGCYTAYFMQIQSLLCAQRYYTKQIFTRICPPKCPPNVDISFFLFGKHVPLNVPLNVPPKSNQAEQTNDKGEAFKSDTKSL